MTTAEAREVLIRYNAWRRYDGPLEQTPLHPEPKEIGEAIDVAIEVLSKKQNERKPVHNAKEMWKEMRLEAYAQASGNRHEPNYSDESTKMFSLCDIDEIFEKIGNSTIGAQHVECIEFDNEFEKQVSHLLASVLNGEYEYNEGFVKHTAQYLLGFAKHELKPVPFSCGHENGKPAEWSGQIEGGTNERKRDSIPCR